jgi:hypothetical protein
VESLEFIWVLISSFIIGAIGALLIVWLRWTGAMPRFSSSVEIAVIEDEYNKVSDYITKRIENDEEIKDPEVHHSDNLRDDIWRQRTRSFAVSALLYVVLGGFTAVLFVGLETQNVLDPLIITKLLAAGALWTTFYSFLDVKKSEETVKTLRENSDKADLTRLDEITTSYEDKLAKMRNEANNKISQVVSTYNVLVEEYEKLTKGHGGR